jgi:hypothetical protein
VVNPVHPISQMNFLTLKYISLCKMSMFRNCFLVIYLNIMVLFYMAHGIYVE